MSNLLSNPLKRMHTSMGLKIGRIYLNYLKVPYCLNLNYEDDLLSIHVLLIFIVSETSII